MHTDFIKIEINKLYFYRITLFRYCVLPEYINLDFVVAYAAYQICHVSKTPRWSVSVTGINREQINSGLRRRSAGNRSVALTLETNEVSLDLSPLYSSLTRIRKIITL